VLNIDISAEIKIDWEKYTFPHPNFIYRDPGQYTDHALYKFSPKDAPHPNLPIVYSAIYRGFCLLKIYDLFVSRSTSFAFDYCYTEKFKNLVSRENYNKLEKYVSDVSFIRGFEIMKQEGFKIETAEGVKYKDLLAQAKRAGAKILTTDKYFAFQCGDQYPKKIFLVED
jgi:hypothetical protein